MAKQSPQARVVLSFGCFELCPDERLLTADGVPLELGARTLDTLIALASRPNEVIGKRELMAVVWPDVTVEEGSLRFHVANLRRSLGDGLDGARYIATLAGRGYCFVAPVARSSRRGEGVAVPADSAPAPFLPARLARMVGRDDSVQEIADALAAARFVTIVGPGGVGKTTVAVAAAHALLTEFDGAVLFVDFGMLSESRMVPAVVGSMLGLPIQSDDPLPALIAHLRHRRMLVVLDNCEHVIETVARLAAALIVAAPKLHILATSREALRVEGEFVHRLQPLAVPPDDPALTAASALAFPATQLFVERAAASGARLKLVDGNAAIVADICRKLDGMALAIELAAARVEAYGLNQTAALLDQRLTLLWPGQRTAPPRQKTLQATLDWSYALLSAAERAVFRALAVFVGPFTLDAALAVVPGETIDAADLFAAIDSLVAKSMVAAAPAGAMMRYRLLDTARAYARNVSADSADRAGLAARHAAYCLRWLEPFAADGPPLSDAAERAPLLVGLNNVRAALDWCFGDAGDPRLGVRLAAAATFVFLALSLTTECHRWSWRAISALDDAELMGVEAMHLQAGLALSSMFTRGNGEEALGALNTSLAIADARGDSLHQLRMLSLLHMFHHRAGETRRAHACAKRSLAVATTIEAPAAVALASAQLGISLTLAGDLSGAAAAYEAALRQPELFHHGFDYTAIASGYLARVRWLQGYPAQAAADLRANVARAARTGQPFSLAFALSFAVPLMLWLGDLSGAEEHMEWFAAHTASHSLPLSLAAARGFSGQLAISRGDPQAGVAILEGVLRELAALNYNVWDTAFNISRSDGLLQLGRFVEAMTLIGETIRRTQENGDLTYIPELLRLKAGVLRAMAPPDAAAAATCLADALDWSRRQGALASELRAAIDLAALWAAEGHREKARAVLRPVFAQFTDGAVTADLAAAQRLLASLDSPVIRPRLASANSAHKA